MRQAIRRIASISKVAANAGTLARSRPTISSLKPPGCCVATITSGRSGPWPPRGSVSTPVIASEEGDPTDWVQWFHAMDVAPP